MFPCIQRSCLQPLAQGGRLPLHLAMENNADAEVIATLLRVHPAAARMATCTTKNHNLVQIFPFRVCLGVRFCWFCACLGVR
jgi:hypothetical protein